MKLTKVFLNLFLILLLAFVLFVLYAEFYHNGPPISQLENFFDNVKFDISGGDSMSSLGEGLYNWELTNLNDFAWPNPLIKYGDHHLFFGWDAIEPGQTVEFSNAFLANTETQELEPVPLLEGQSVAMELHIDFTDEDSLPSRFWKLIGMHKQETYSLGTWNR
jgi:cell division protein YceG involved in septum cleavage